MIKLKNYKLKDTNMTPHEKDLIEQLRTQLNNLAMLMVGTQAATSKTWIELNQILTELKIAAAK
jgi:hypothetical protein